MNLIEFRKQYPQYDDIGDQELLNSIHATYYSEMDIERFYKSVEYDAEPEPGLYEKAKRAFRGEVKGDPGLADPSKFPQPTGPEDYPPGTVDEYGKEITTPGIPKAFGISETGEIAPPIGPKRPLPDPSTITDIPAPPIRDIYPQGERAPGPELPAGLGYLQKPMELLVDKIFGDWDEEKEKEYRVQNPNMAAAAYALAQTILPGVGGKVYSPEELANFAKLPFEEQQNRIIGLSASYMTFGAGTQAAKLIALKAALRYPWLTKPRKGPIKTMFESTWFRRLKVRERGLLVRNVDDMIKGMEAQGMKEADILRTLQRSDLTDAAYKRFAKAQKIEPAEGEAIITPEPVKKPVKEVKPVEVAPKPVEKPKKPRPGALKKEISPEPIAEVEVKKEVAPSKFYKPEKAKPSKVSTLRGRIKQMGGINFLNFKGELKEMPVGVKYLSKKTGLQIDLAQEQLRGEGWLSEKEDLLDILRDPGNLRRNKVVFEGVEKPEAQKTDKEKRIAKEMEREVEAPPKGEYVQVRAEDLPKGAKMNIIEGKSKDGWDLYEITEKDPFTIILKDGGEIELSPHDVVEVLKVDLTAAKPAEIPPEAQAEALDIYLEGREKPKKKELWEMTEAEWVVSGREKLKAAAITRGAKTGKEQINASLMSRAMSKSFGQALRVKHREGISKALKEGQPVPAEVLKDYPDLKKPGHLREEAKEKFEVKKPKQTKAIEKDFGSEIDKISKKEAQRGSLERPAPGEVPAKEPKVPFRFTSLRKEAQFKASQGVRKIGLKTKVTEVFTSLAQKASREFEHIPKTKEFAELRVSLLRLAKQKGVASDRTKRALQGITLDLNKNTYDLFSRKVIMDDLAATKDEGKSVPTWYSDKEYARVNDAVRQSPAVQAAIEKRDRFWDALKTDYIEAMKAIGFDVTKKVNRDSYFRHQVLDYLNVKGIFGTGRKLKTPRARGFLKKRLGSELEINTDYLQAEHEVMAQMLYDIEVANTIKKVDTEYNIIDSLKKKAIAERKKTGNPDISWEDYIPEGYTTWQPTDGNIFYMADSIPAKIATQLEKGLLEEFGISKDQLRKVLAVGGKRRQFVVKDEVAATLDNMARLRSENPFLEAQRTLINKWKQWQLISPRRLFKYNIRNLTGDAEAVFVGNPSGFTKLPKALRELYSVFVERKTMPPNMHDWFERGGMQSTLQAQEMGDINTLKIFIQLHAKGKKISELPKTAWNQYWKTARLSTDFREATLRYANYLDYLEQIKSSKDGLPKNYGASIPEEIKGIKDPKDKAFMLSNDLVGAYDRISVAGQTFREHIFPFWSFQEINMRRYFRLFKNAANNDRLAEAVGKKALGSAVKSTFTAIRVGKLLIKVTAFWVGLQVYNHLIFPEEEKELSRHVRNRPHIILGRDKNGKIDYFSRIGVLGDFLEWFGLDIAPKYVDALMTGKMTPKEVALDMAESPVNKTVQGMFPFIKVGAEVITRRALFPDVFKPRVIRDRAYHIARSFAMEEEFKKVFKKPSRPYKTTLKKFFY